MGIGIPGSGKTTALKSFAERNSYKYICPDDIRFELTGNTADQTKNREVWQEAYNRIEEGLKNNETVVFDATFVDVNQRQKFISFCKDKGADKIQGVFVDTPFEIALERNQKRERNVPEYAMNRMNENLRKFLPEIHDGFDSFFVLDEDLNLVSAEMNYGENEENKVLHKEFNKII